MKEKQSHFNQIELFFKSFNFLNGLVVSILFFSSSACTNIGEKLNQASRSKIILSDVAISDTSGSFTINQVVPSALNPGTLYDLIGSDGGIGTYCSGNFGTCNCEYTFSLSGIGSQTVSVENSYSESDLLRCSSTAVPAGVSSFQVRIVTVPSTTPGATGSSTGYYSNQITVNLSSSGTFASSSNYIDLTSAKSYVPVQRFQCRKREFIRNPLDTNIIDPFQSIDPRVIYPFNYYTTNVSESLLRAQQLPDQSWECSLTGTQSGDVPWWANPNVFSMTSCSTSFCSGDQQLIYPQNSLFSGKIPVTNASATGKRRASFALSSSAYGVFQVPVKAAVSPKDYVSGNYAVIGYAAKPIPSVSGSSSCPAISLPLNSTWVKLWNFRATDITSPQIVTGSQSILNSTIACNTSSGVFPSCDKSVPNGSVFGRSLASSSINNFSSPPVLTSRVGFLSSSVGNSSSSACYNIDSSWASGNESWFPSPYRFDSTFSPPVSYDQMKQFPWNLYMQASSNAMECPNVGGDLWLDETVAYGGATHGCNSAAYAVPAGTPFDTKVQLTTTPLVPNGDNYTDQIFVVTDPNVSDSSMRNGASSVSEYFPITYRSKADCVGPTIDATCTNPPIHWDINVKEVGSSTGADVYPLCVLQFYD